MSQPNCGSRLLAWIVRGTNIVVTLLGLAMAAYGVALIVRGAGMTLSGAVLGLGLIDATMGLLIVLCGYRRLFFLRLYTLVLGLLEIAQAVVCGLFLTPSYQQKIVDELGGSTDLQNWVQSNLNTAGYFFLTIVIFQAFALLFVTIQCFNLDKGFDENEWDTARLSKLITRDDRYSQLRDEGMVEAATTRSRDKYSAYYEKYGLGGAK